MNGAMKSDATNMEMPSHHRNSIIFVWEKWEKSEKKKYEKNEWIGTHTLETTNLSTTTTTTATAEKRANQMAFAIQKRDTKLRHLAKFSVQGNYPVGEFAVISHSNLFFLFCIWLRFFFAPVLLHSKIYIHIYLLYVSCIVYTKSRCHLPNRLGFVHSLTPVSITVEIKCETPIIIRI